MQRLVSLNELKNEAQEFVGYRLPKETFNDFTHPNNRLLAGVTCLRAGYVDVAYNLFDSIAREGPKEKSQPPLRLCTQPGGDGGDRCRTGTIRPG